MFALELLFIFLVLAAQFESFIDPLVIVLSVPPSMMGALLALTWSGGSLKVYSQIGLITKHGILIIEFTNQLRGQGMEMIDVLVKASSQRLRPTMCALFARQKVQGASRAVAKEQVDHPVEQPA